MSDHDDVAHWLTWLIILGILSLLGFCGWWYMQP